MYSPLHAHDREPPLAPHEVHPTLTDLVRELARTLGQTLRGKPERRRRRRQPRQRREPFAF